MTVSNRTLNRILLALVGLVTLGLALLIVANSVAASPVKARSALDLDSVNANVLVAVGAILAALLALAWALSRGRGATRSAITDRQKDGDISVDTRFVERVLQHELASDRRLGTISVSSYRVRGRTALEVRVAVRPGDTSAVLETVEPALRRLDRALGRSVPTLLHLVAARSGRVRVE